MRLIDADALFNAAFQVWGIKADAGDTGVFMEMINSAPTICLPPNNPLTLEELREMDGEPVFLTPIRRAYTDGEQGAWALVDLNQRMCRVSGGGLAVFENCGKTWLAYRRKPEEGAA